MSKQIEVELTLENNQASFTTNKLNGQLDGIIIDSDNKVELIIESELGYIIFKDKDISGVGYYAVRSRTRASEMSPLDKPGWDLYNLNEELMITAIGPKKTNVKVILRLI